MDPRSPARRLVSPGEGGLLGKYELLRHVATGGMAEIWLARARGIEKFEKRVIVKRILSHLARDPHFLRMFIDEARIAATLQHPNVVSVYDIGESQGEYFFAMEYVHGRDLSRILRKAIQDKERVPFGHSLTIAMGVCAGLHYAHEKVGFDGKPLALVHRDVSPQNVMVSLDGGGVKILDFGIAKMATRTGQTREGMLKGKTPYMSPEQCLGQELDRRSDIFSLSILLWELTTTKRLFREDGEYATLKAITETDARPPSSVQPDFPPALERIIMKGLERDREKRWQTAEELQLALEDCARKLEIPASPVALSHYLREKFSQELEEEQSGPVPTGNRPTRSRPRPLRRWRPLLVAVMGAVLLAGAGAVVLPSRKAEEQAPPPTPVAVPVAAPAEPATPPARDQAAPADPQGTTPKKRVKKSTVRPSAKDDLDSPFPH